MQKAGDRSSDARVPVSARDVFLARFAHPTIPVIVAVVAACAIVVFGAAGSGLILPPLVVEGAALRLIRIAGVAVAVAGVAWLLTLRPRLLAGSHGRQDPTLGGLSTAAAVMVVLAGLSLLAPRPPGPPAEGEVAAESGERLDRSARPPQGSAAPLPGIPPSGFGAGRASPGVPEPAEPVTIEEGVRPQAGDLWPTLRRVLLALLLGMVLMYALRALGPRARVGFRPPGVLLPVDGARAERGLEESLHEMEMHGADPRGRITAAYLRLLAALAEAGAPRAPYEAPHEHLERVLRPLGVRPAAMHRLAELYILAQFSARPLTERHRMDAVEALELALSDLRGAGRAAAATSAGVG